MLFMPFNILGMWFRGLLSIAILAGGIALLKRWYEDSHVVEVEIPAGLEVGSDRWRERVLHGVNDGSARRVFRFDPGWNPQTGELAAALALLAWATMGRGIGNSLSRLTLRSGQPGDKPHANPGGKRESKKVRRLYGSRKDYALALT